MVILTLSTLPSPSSSFSSSSWLGSFKIPEKFSKITMKTLSEEMITEKARVEIISAIAIQVHQHTEYPTSEECMQKIDSKISFP